MTTETEPTEPLCNHPGGTTLGHEVPPTPMWAVKRNNTLIWYCPECNRTINRNKPTL